MRMNRRKSSGLNAKPPAFKHIVGGLFFLLAFALPVHAQEVGSYSELQAAALAGSGEGTIKLTKDILDGKTELVIGRNITLDLNGHSLTIDLPVATGKTSNGIKINSGVTLTIVDSNLGASNALTVRNNASASTTDGHGAGINSTDGTLEIKSGRVNAFGGYLGAGIGGGANKASGRIMIDGGTVTAEGGEAGAGIGSVYQSIGSNITIYKGTVTARGGTGAAGIGGGISTAGGFIYIYGGAINATGGRMGAGIGGGWESSGGYIYISGAGTIDATGGNATGQAGAGAGIGGGGGGLTNSSGASGSIRIIGIVKVTAKGGTSELQGGGAGIGSGGSGSNGQVGAAGNAENPIIIENSVDFLQGGPTGGTGANGRNGASIGMGGGLNSAGAAWKFHNLTVTHNTGGSVYPGTSRVSEGSKVFFSVFIHSGFVLREVTVDGIPETLTDSSQFNFNIPAMTAPKTVTVTFDDNENGGNGGTGGGGGGGSHPPPPTTPSTSSSSSGGCSTSGGPFGLIALVTFAAFGWVRRKSPLQGI